MRERERERKRINLLMIMRLSKKLLKIYLNSAATTTTNNLFESQIHQNETSLKCHQIKWVSSFSNITIYLSKYLPLPGCRANPLYWCPSDPNDLSVSAGLSARLFIIIMGCCRRHNCPTAPADPHHTLHIMSVGVCVYHVRMLMSPCIEWHLCGWK